MVLDEQARAFIAEVEAAGVPPIQTMDPVVVRALQQNFVPRLSGALEQVAGVEDHAIAGPSGPLPLRIYTPESKPRGILVYLHGGGWVIGSLDTADAACRALARRTPCIVVSVGYRLAPEHKFPAAIDDAVRATSWVAANAERLGVDPTRVAIGGDSAGGALAAAVTLDAREREGPPLRFAMLVYPAADFKLDRPSYRTYGSGCLITTEEVRWYWESYLRSPQDATSEFACPLRAASLRGLPPALVLLAECDPIRDEAEAYANRLRADGVPVQTMLYEGMIHGFFTMPGVMDRARVAYDHAAEALRRAFL